MSESGRPRQAWLWLLPAGLVLAWLATFAWLWLGGGYTHFLAANLWPIMAMAVVLLSVFFIGVAARRQVGGAVSGRLLQAGVLLLPLAYIAFVVPEEGLTSYAFATRSLDLHEIVASGQSSAAAAVAPATPASPISPSSPVSPAPAAAPSSPEPVAAAPVASTEPVMPPLPPMEPMDANLLELTQRSETYRDQLVIAQGRVARPEQLAAGQFILFRFVVSCCVSDAMPLGLLVRYEGKAPLPAVDDWIEIRGTFKMVPGTYGERPVIDATEFRAVEPPDNPYINDLGAGGAW